MAGLDKIPAYVKGIGDKEAQVLSTAENFFRENLTPLEEAQAMERYIKRGYSVDDIVGRGGVGSGLGSSIRSSNELIL